MVNSILVKVLISISKGFQGKSRRKTSAGFVWKYKKGE